MTTSISSTVSTKTVNDVIYPPPSHNYRNIFFGLLFLGVGTAVFIWLGGLRWARRVLAGDHMRYRKVDGDDIEK